MRSTAFAVAALLCAVAAWGAETAGPTDAQIAHIVVTANQIDIDASKLAKSGSQNSNVKAATTTSPP